MLACKYAVFAGFIDVQVLVLPFVGKNLLQWFAMLLSMVLFHLFCCSFVCVCACVHARACVCVFVCVLMES